MQIVIPMSGAGSRFKAKGYDKIKPLIEVDGKPIIEHVINLFPGENDFLFICREDHMEQYDLVNLLNKLKPGSTIIGIPPHKYGPVYAVLQAENLVKDDEPIMVSYCDYFMNWNYADFKKEVAQTPQAGNVICYTGFHPHLLHKNVYAGCLVGDDGFLTKIQEKHSFEANKMLGHHSGGAYYFESGNLLKHYFKDIIEKDININGEYYVSMVYELMLNDNRKVGVYDKVEHFCQWGTPEDLEEYLYWSSVFKKYGK